MARVLLANSQPLFNEALEALCSRDHVHQVVGRCSSAEDTFAHVSSLRPDLVLGDDYDAELLLAAIRSGAAGVAGKTYGASTVLRVVGAVLDGQGVVPRGMLVELTPGGIGLGR